MPTPSPKETRQDWMSRCIPALREEGKPQDQAIAVCTSMWQQHEKQKDTAGAVDEEAMSRVGAMRPRDGEEHETWMQRCMVVGDEATCHALWTQHMGEDDAMKRKRKKPPAY